MSDKSGLEKAGTWAFRAYCAFCLIATSTVFFDPELVDSEFLYRRILNIWEGVGSISDPVFRVICYGLVIVLGFLAVLGWIGGLVAWMALILGIILPYYLFKGLLWLASFSLGAAIVVAVVLTATLVVILRAYWDPIIEWIARVVLVVMSLFGLAGQEKHLFTRLGSVGLLCGLILFAGAMWQRVPALLKNLQKNLKHIEQEYVVIAPVGKWSDTLDLSKLQAILTIHMDADVVIQDNHGRCVLSGPRSLEERGLKRMVYIHPPDTVRFRSRTGNPVKVLLFTTSRIPVKTFHEPNRSPACSPAQKPPVLTSKQKSPANPVGGDVSAPVLISKVEPEYSEQAKEARVQGTVVVLIEIDKDGRARNAQIKQSLGYGLDEKALEAITKWRFKPAFKSGVPVTTRATVNINFKLL